MVGVGWRYAWGRGRVVVRFRYGGGRVRVVVEVEW